MHPHVNSALSDLGLCTPLHVSGIYEQEIPENLERQQNSLPIPPEHYREACGASLLRQLMSQTSGYCPVQSLPQSMWKALSSKALRKGAVGLPRQSQELTQETLRTPALIEAGYHMRGSAPQGPRHSACIQAMHMITERENSVLAREPPGTSEMWQIPCGEGPRAQS